jgi:putative nucleotidyltransferase with HDIG domain
VQVYAVELAKRLGISDENSQKSIQAAALLHDMGKLAIPEHILNKPGKLTSVEFDKMKRHADIGADLLSSVRFPYPVVPIVRHHHENWNGSGYPSGLAKTDIPLGARILSVVDCFDALTSDRPYRPRLSDADAFAILVERRGTMYDPLVVDTFIRVHDEISIPAKLAGEQARSLTSAFSEAGNEPLQLIRENATRGAAIVTIETAIAKSATPEEVLITVFDGLKDLLPVTTCAIYAYMPGSDSLVCTHSFGDPESRMPGLRIPNGERVTGWAFANGMTIANSKATLDLHNVADLFNPPLRASLVTPLRQGATAFGALAVYDTRDEPFTDEHRYAFERVAGCLAGRLPVTSERPRSELMRIVRASAS